jgi:hypothetical protein
MMSLRIQNSKRREETDGMGEPEMAKNHALGRI